MDCGKLICSFLIIGYLEYSVAQPITQAYPSECHLDGSDVILECIGSTPGLSPIWTNPEGTIVSNACNQYLAPGVKTLSCDPKCSVSPFPTACNLTVTLSPIPAIDGSWICTFGGQPSPETINVIKSVTAVNHTASDVARTPYGGANEANLSCTTSCSYPAANLTWAKGNEEAQLEISVQDSSICDGVTTLSTSSKVSVTWNGTSNVTIQCTAYQETGCLPLISITAQIPLQAVVIPEPGLSVIIIVVIVLVCVVVVALILGGGIYIFKYKTEHKENNNNGDCGVGSISESSKDVQQKTS